MENKKYLNSFVNFDKVTTSKDGKQIIIFIGRMMISLNVNFVKAIIKNLESSQDLSRDKDSNKEVA